MPKLLRWISILAVLGIVSKILGFVREASLAAYFGASAETDTYLVAMIVPYLLFGLVNMSIETAAIPLFAEAEHNQSSDSYRQLIWSAFHLIFFASLVLVILGMAFAPFWVPKLAPGFPEQQSNLAIRLTRILLPMMVFQGFAAWAKGLLQSRQRFLAPALIGLPFNLISILFIVLAGKYFGITLVAIGTVLAMGGQFFVQWPAIRAQRIRYAPVLDLASPGLRRMGKMVPPVLLGVGAEQLNHIVNRVLASGLSAGSISALNFAERGLGLSQGVLGFPLVNVLYSELAKRAASGRMEEYWAFLGRGITLIGFAMIPASFLVAFLAEDITRLLFQRGAFTAQDTKLTAFALLFYALGIPFLVWRDYLGRAFYALQDAMTPLKNGLWMVAVNIILNLLLVKPLKHGGLALGSSIAAALGTVGLAFLLYRRARADGLRDTLQSLTRMSGASMLMGFAVWVLASALPIPTVGVSFIWQSLRLTLIVICGALVYGVACWYLRISEMKRAVHFTRQFWHRLSGRMESSAIRDAINNWL